MATTKSFWSCIATYSLGMLNWMDQQINAHQTSKANENSRIGDSRSISSTSRLYILKLFNFSYDEIPALL